MANKFLSAIKARYFSSSTDTAIELSTSSDSYPKFKIDASGKLQWGNGSSDTYVAIERQSASKIIVSTGLEAKSITINNNYTFSNSDGSEGQVIATYGNGVLHWSSAASDALILQWIGL